jgi:hypothetical protein
VKGSPLILIAVGLVALAGCATVSRGMYEFGTVGASATDVAIIRPANKDERQYKPSVAARIFGKPAGTAQIQYLVPGTNISLEKDVRGYSLIRVPPGSYLVRVLCHVGGFSEWFDVRIKAEAGRQSLLECVGATGNNGRVTVREVDAK